MEINRGLPVPRGLRPMKVLRGNLAIQFVSAGVWGVRQVSLLSLSHNLHDHALLTLPLEFGVEDPLPGAEIETACGDRNYDLMMNQQCLQVRVSVVFASIMVFVIALKRRQVVEPLVNVY